MLPILILQKLLQAGSARMSNNIVSMVVFVSLWYLEFRDGVCSRPGRWNNSNEYDSRLRHPSGFLQLCTVSFSQ